MRVGDVLEWIAAACLVASSVLATNLAWVGLLTGGVCLAYFAQCHAQQAVPKPRLPRLRLRLPARLRRGET